MNYASNHKPIFLRLDTAYKQLKENESGYILNHSPLLNVHAGNGSNLGVSTPLPGNYPACAIQQPAGENYSIGSYYSAITKETYSWVYNSNGVHYIDRINAQGVCEVVYFGCLTLSAAPEHAIEQWRAYLIVERICPNRDGKYLVWVDGTDTPIGFIDVEASIATNNFTTPFFNFCAGSGCEPAQLCVPEICSCLQGEFIKLPDIEIGLSNNILDKPLQFAIRHVYYDGRRSEWGGLSTTYFQNSKGCFSNISGYPRCLKLRIPVGNPLVEKIEIAYTDGLRNEGGALVWYLYDTVEKYKKYNNSQEKWYERGFSEQTKDALTSGDCSFDYIFCNDKQKIDIDQAQFDRIYNPMPRKPQGILPIKDALGFYNYITGNCPLDQTEIAKFNININCDDTDSCEREYATITVRAIICSPNNTTDATNIDQIDYKSGWVWRNGGDTINAVDDSNDPAYFGGERVGITTGNNTSQKFGGNARNMIVYIEGTDYWAQMKQWKADENFNNPREVGVLANMDTQASRDTVYYEVQRDRVMYYQEAKIRVKKGTRGFIRMVSHEAASGIGDNQSTSGQVIALLNDINNWSLFYSTSPGSFGQYLVYDKEIYFDTCNGDVTLQNVFLVWNLVSGNTPAFSGYITDNSGRPTEGLLLHYDGDSKIMSVTDWNGFYCYEHFIISTSPNMDVKLLGELNCLDFSEIETMQLFGQEDAITRHNEKMSSTTYETDYYATPEVIVKDCDGVPLSGVRVAISGSKSVTTDPFGKATFRIRNYYTRDRVLVAIPMDDRLCFIRDCNGICNPCMPILSVAAPSCFLGTPPIIMGTVILNRDNTLDAFGLKAGGRYGFGFVVKGDCGRISAVNQVKYMDIPRTQEKGKMNFCSFFYDATGMILPDWATCVDIVRTINLNPYPLQWKIDKIERTGNGKIKLTIQSLNDYNALYNDETNTVYQWLKGDRVEFIRNGDNSILSIAQYGLLNYLTISPFHDTVLSQAVDAPANYFNQLLIEDDGRLGDITEGSIIEIQRPRPSVTEPVYFSICANIPVVGGRLLYDYGTFNTFDTFLVTRILGGILGDFEHHSPSDFWGTYVSDVGKRYVVDQYETEKRYGRNITINSSTQYNYFGDLVKKFSAPGQGDIIAMNIKDARVIQAICENDSFMAASADDLLRVGQDNIIRALPPDAIISDQQPQIGGEYGCQYPDIGSIYFGDTWTIWVDVSKHTHVTHDYRVAKNSGEAKVELYFRKRCQQKETFNRSATNDLDKYRFARGFNQQSGMTMLTLKKLRDSSYNNEKKPFQKSNDTILYHPTADDWFGFASFTPERYGKADLFDDAGCAVLMYQNGIPYVTPILANIFNQFFGVSCDEMVLVTVNKFPEKMKRALSLEVQSTMMFFSPEVLSDNPNFDSEIPPIRWVRSNNKWNASFLGNKKSKSGLYGNGGSLLSDTRGFWINILLVRDNTDNLKYGTTDNAKRVLYNETDQIFTKYAVVEESGFTNNL